MPPRICLTCQQPFTHRNAEVAICDDCADAAERMKQSEADALNKASGYPDNYDPQPRAADATFNGSCTKCGEPVTAAEHRCCRCGEITEFSHECIAALLSKIARLEAAGDKMMMHLVALHGNDSLRLAANWQSAKQ